MGLLNFLKSKFSKKKKENIEEKVFEVEKQNKEETIKVEQPIEKKAETIKENTLKKEEPVLAENKDINSPLKDKKQPEIKVNKETKSKDIIKEKKEIKPSKKDSNVPLKVEVKAEEKEDTEEKVEVDNIDRTSKYIDKPATISPKQEIIEKKKEEEARTRAYVRGLKKSNKGFMAKLKSLTSMFRKIDEDYFDELEQILIEADVGVELSMKLIDQTKDFVKKNKVEDPNVINEVLIEEMFQGYQQTDGNYPKDIQFVNNGPTVLLVVGVNGVGKTTTIAKLANRYKKMGKKVLLVAGDTFRAGAVEQLIAWAKRIGVDIVSGKENSDPSSLCYDGLLKAKKENYDLVIVDTAGRLQNKTYLMDELGKMKRVMTKIIPSAPHETFLIIDANTGQNGVEQARVFKEVTPLSGIVITKMDGTSKGGIILAIRDKLGIPVRFMGLGEALDDLKEFDLDSYLYGLLIGDEEE